MQAQVLKPKLETTGIPARLEYEGAGLVFGVILDGLGEVRVMVPADLAEEALAVIQPEETPLTELPEDETED